ncbi:MAG: glutathione S-transferase family protein [Hyphomicrobiales bacterium]|nr:glutathione S-transferase family protein [Hyphomicrobiales bacterium]
MNESYELIIGNKNLSSWSLRPWLVLKHFGISFSEVLVDLKAAGRRFEILKHSPAGTVPVLKHGDLVIPDSLAIIEYIAETHSDKSVWPDDRKKRAVARSVAAEMHSGFERLRAEFPMYFVNQREAAAPSEGAKADMQRIVGIWRDCRAGFGDGGEFLFGAFSAADAMFAPVASRFTTYSVDLAQLGDDGTAARYRDNIMAMPELAEWADEARKES